MAAVIEVKSTGEAGVDAVAITEAAIAVTGAAVAITPETEEALEATPADPLAITPEIEVKTGDVVALAIALGLSALASVTIIVPFKIATGIPLIDPAEMAVGMAVMLLADMILCNAAVGIAVELAEIDEKAFGKADLSIAGMAEAIALGRAEIMLAKEAGSKLVGLAVAVIPAADMTEAIT